jgi:HK97 family phage portal protein
MLKFFYDTIKKISGQKLVEKSLTQSEVLHHLRSGTSFCWDGCNDSFLAPAQAYYYFENVSPLQSTVKKIAQTVSRLPLAVVSDSNPDEMITDHPILQILQRPGYGLTGQNLLVDLCISYLLTDEAWLVLMGRPNAEPVSCVALRPYNVDTEGSTAEYYPTLIRTNSPTSFTQRNFYPVTESGVTRYFDTPDGAGAMNELVPVIGTKAKSRDFRGLSRLMSLQRPLTQMISGDIYNTKLLNSGTKPFMMLSPKEGLTESEMEDIELSLEQLKGAHNVGGIFILPTAMDDVSTPTTNRDLEYQDMLAEVKQRIADAYYMPLALISPDAMTYSNYSTAQVAFYDGPVSNLVYNLFPQIVKILSSRLGITESMHVTYNQHDVPALQMRQAERMAELSRTYTMTLNELRDMLGLDPLSVGEEIYMPGNLIPVSIPGVMGDEM